MRDRLAQIEHLKLDLTPDFAKRTIRGTTTLTFKPIAKPLAKLELEAVGLTIDGVTTQGATLKEYQVTEDKLVLAFEPPLAVGSEAVVIIAYRAQLELL